MTEPLDGGLRVDRVVLAWNADSGPWNALLGSLRKAFGRSGCPLCDLTHGLAGERAAWTACRGELPAELVGLHRDELSAAMREAAGELPAVLVESGGRILRLLARDEIAGCGDASELQARILAAADSAGVVFRPK